MNVMRISGAQSIVFQGWESALSTYGIWGITKLGSQCLYPLNDIKLVLMYCFI